MENFIVVDLDGCVSNDAWRRRHLPAGYADGTAACHEYDEYHSLCLHDRVMNAEVLQPVAWRVTLLFVTARPERFRGHTTKWIARTFSRIGQSFERWQLLMRPNGDTTRSAELKPRLLSDYLAARPSCVVAAYDDREDVLEAYAAMDMDIGPLYKADDAGVMEHIVAAPAPEPTRDVAAIMHKAAETFRERNAVYGDNYRNVGAVVRALFPDGVPAHLPSDDRWHLFELVLVKLTRFANSEFGHTDSIHDAMVYTAMVEAMTLEGAENG